MSTAYQLPPDTAITKTFLVFDRSTGEILSIHHMSAASGTKLPDPQTLAAQALRTVATSLGAKEDALAVTTHETGDIDPACFKVDVDSRRVIRVDPAQR